MDRKFIPVSVSISSYLLENPTLPCKVEPRDLLSSFIDAVKNLATQSKAQMKNNFLQVEATIRNKLGMIREIRSRHRTHIIDIEEDCLEDDFDNVLRQLLQIL